MFLVILCIYVIFLFYGFIANEIFLLSHLKAKLSANRQFIHSTTQKRGGGWGVGVEWGVVRGVPHMST